MLDLCRTEKKTAYYRLSSQVLLHPKFRDGPIPKFLPMPIL